MRLNTKKSMQHTYTFVLFRICKKSLNSRKCTGEFGRGDECGKFESEWSLKKPGVKLVVSSGGGKWSLRLRLFLWLMRWTKLPAADDTGAQTVIPLTPSPAVASSSLFLQQSPEIATGVEE
jgi:hypothetical protein